MTSASELFYNRRSRIGRNTIELELDSPVDRFSHHNHNHIRRHNNISRRDRHDLDGCDPLRRSPHLRHTIRRHSLTEREVVQVDEGSSQAASGSFINSGNIRSIHNPQRFTGNGRLPGAVLLARERLLQRLRGVSLSGNRRSNRTPSDIHDNDFTPADDFHLVDAGDWETEISREWLAGVTPFINSQTDHLLPLQETRKRPPGLTQQALDSLHLEFFIGDKEESEGGTVSRASRECCICLDNFLEGDELIRLSCGHRFHSCCLDPWVRTCGDCPYCRTGIEVTNYGVVEES